MKLKWLSYFKIIPDIYLVAFIFDPRSRSKFDLLHEMLDTYYEMLGLDDNDDEPIDVTQIVTRVRLLINELLQFYSISSTSNDESTSSALPPTPSSTSLKFGTKFLADRRKIPRASTSTSHSELEVYLTTVFEFGETL